MSVYLKAAMKVDTGQEKYSCNALDSYLDKREYASLFTPIQGDISGAWLTHVGAYRLTRGMDFKEWRVLALLFMHWISSDKPKRRKHV